MALVEKIARVMDAWRYGHDTLPPDIDDWVMPLSCTRAVLISPRAGTAHGAGSKAGTVIDVGWWIIRAETGCLYAVSDDEFHRKYRFLEPPGSPNTPIPFVVPGAYHLGGTIQ